jgi:hypothetical protein
MLSAQNGKVFSHSQYGKLRKVYSIWICTRPPQDEQNSIAHFSVTKNNVIGTNREVMENYDMLSVIMIYLGNPDADNHVGIVKLLGILLSANISATDKKQILQNEFSIPMTETIEEEVSNMFNLSQALVEESEARGEARGFKIGSEQANLAAIRNLMKAMNFTAQETMWILCIPEDECANYLAKISQ